MSDSVTAARPSVAKSHTNSLSWLAYGIHKPDILQRDATNPLPAFSFRPSKQQNADDRALLV
jgi:hypothetical protein